jgi:CRISPR-associated protein Csy1
MNPPPRSVAPVHWEKHGQQLVAAGRFVEAAASFEEAVRLEPTRAIAWARLAKIRMALQDNAAAEAALAQACALRPADAGLQVLLAHLLREENKAEAALGACRRALELDPGNLEAAVAEALMLPPVYADAEDLRSWRQRYTSGLDALHARIEAWQSKPRAVLGLEWHNFHLAYQGGNDVALQARYSDFVAALLARALPGFQAPPRRPGHDRGRRIRVGFASSHFRSCTIGDYFLRWVTDLPRERFHVSTFYTGHGVDERTAEYARGSDHFIQVNEGVEAIAIAIRRSPLDILVLPEVGSTAISNALANLQLAPQQCAAWGHPVSTGSRTTRHFISCAEMEPPDAVSHYSETLLCLPGIGVNYRRPPTPTPLPRAALGLEATHNVYLCPQSLWKVHPDTDELLLQILAHDEHAVVLFFSGTSRGQTRALAARLERGMAERGIAPRRQIKFLPTMPRERFRQLMAMADVMLDCAHWSGGNSTLDALASGLPVVTLDGRYMRGRQTSAMLRIIGVDELIARDAVHYVEVALRVAGDRSLRARMSERILAELPRLFDRSEPVAALADCLEDVAKDRTRSRRP